MTAQEKTEPEFEEQEYLIGRKADICLTIPAGASFRLEAVTEDGEIHTLGQYSPSVLTIERFRIHGYASLRASGQILPTVSIKTRQTQEPHDLEPPIRREPPRNMMGKIRERVRREMGGLQRERFLENDTDHPGYELDEEEPDRFEEEIMADLEANGSGQPVPNAPGDDADLAPGGANPGATPDNPDGVSDDNAKVPE